MKQTGMLVVLGFKFWILVSLRVFRAKRQYFVLPRSRFIGFRGETQNYAKRNKSNFRLNFLFR